MGEVMFRVILTAFAAPAAIVLEMFAPPSYLDKIYGEYTQEDARELRTFYYKVAGIEVLGLLLLGICAWYMVNQ